MAITKPKAALGPAPAALALWGISSNVQQLHHHDNGKEEFVAGGFVVHIETNPENRIRVQH